MKFKKKNLTLERDTKKNFKSLNTFKVLICKLINCSKKNSKIQMFLLLTSHRLKTGMPNKFRFFSFFLFMTKCENCKYQNNENSYKLKIVTWNDRRWVSLQIFKKNKKFPYLTYILENQNGKLHIELLPF